jgi:quercetin dioxygenase-like cupin family protein
MRSWNLKAVEVEPHEPQILSTGDDARTILLRIPPGEQLGEHGVHEHARIVIVDGEVEVATPQGERVSASSGHMLEFAPGERHAVVAKVDARVLLLLSPWPGEGHPGAMTLEEKASVRDRAAEHHQPFG